MKLLINLLLILSLCSSAFGQQIVTLLQGSGSDSSLYHLAQINSNEYWMGGELGVLKKIDSLGNISSFNYPNKGMDILKIEKVKDYVYIITDNAIIYRYDLKTNTFLTKIFPDFKNKCFYDIIALRNGKLLVCGGAKGISNAKKRIPKGFIAIIDQDLTEINVVWKNYRKFVWSLLELNDGSVLASTFNGINTKLLRSNNYYDWEVDTKIKGLVHEIRLFENKLYYSGTKNIHMDKKGIFGIEGQDQMVMKNTGCLWSMTEMGSKILSVTSKGQVLIIDKNTAAVDQITMPDPVPIYDIQLLSGSKYVVVGRGQSVFTIDFLKEPDVVKLPSASE